MPQPAKALGLWTCTALVMGNMIGSGIFLLPASLAVYGGISLIGWLFTAAGAWLLALVFASLARSLPSTGGPYAYSRAGLGDFAGFLVAWGYYISLLTGNAAIAVAMVSYASVFWPVLSASPAAGAVTAMAAIALLTIINIRGVREAGIVQLVTTVLKLTPLLAVTAFGLGSLELSHFQPFNLSGQSTFSAISATAALTLWAFLGLESATIPAGDVKDANKTIPRATMLGTLLTAVIYILATIAVMGLVSPADLATSDAPFADAASRLWGSAGGLIVAAGAAISCFGALNGWVLNTGQIPAAAARDGIFPERFAYMSRFGTPAASLIFSALLVCLLIAANYTRGLVGLFTFVILLSTTTVLIPYVFSAIARIILAYRDGVVSAGTSVLKVLLISVLAFLYSVWAVAGAGKEAVYWGFILLLAGLPVYAWQLVRATQNPESGQGT